MKIMHAVETLYEFDTSQAPESIGRNANRAQALRTKMRFVYRVRRFSPPLQPIDHRRLSQEPNIGGPEDPHHPYRHPIIQKVINITWFKNKDDDGILFYDYFSPIPIEVIALALTAVRIKFTRLYPGS